MRVHFTSLGCKLNQAEVERLARRFVAAGHRVVGTLAEADLHVVNSCTVTQAAARDSRKAAGRGGRLGGGRRTVLTGCYAAERPEEAARLAGVDLVVSNEEKERLLERVEAAFPDLAASCPDAGGQGLPPYLPFAAEFSGRAGESAEFAESADFEGFALAEGPTRALVKIEDGCNMRCSFCIIPRTRGAQRSRPPGEILAEVRNLLAAGFREIVLTGVQISAYGYRPAAFSGEDLLAGLPGLSTRLDPLPAIAPGAWPATSGGRTVRLAGLVRRLMAETDVPRLRLTSIAPWDVDEELLDLWRERRLARHLHLSLQSGSTATLVRMRRPYTACGFLETLDRVRRAVPGVALTTDVIVGFPGESEAEFGESLATVAAAGFAKVHVFPYSPREGTEAAALPGAVPPRVQRERMVRMLALGRRAEGEFAASHLGRRATVLWERPKGGMGVGLTDNYLRVYCPEGAALRNRFSEVELVGAVEGGLRGALLGAPLS